MQVMMMAEAATEKMRSRSQVRRCAAKLSGAGAVGVWGGGDRRVRRNLGVLLGLRRSASLTQSSPWRAERRGLGRDSGISKQVATLSEDAIEDNGRQFKPAIALLERAIGEGAFPGAVFAVAQGGQVLALEGVGRFTFDPSSPAVSAETSYDLASLTKVMATTAMAMLLWQRGRVDLEQPLDEVLPEFRSETDESVWRRRVTLRHLLTHSSGLPAYVPLYERYTRRSELLKASLRLPLEAEPGSRAAYSDPGFILLGLALERLATKSLDQFCAREIYEPLGMRGTRFCPVEAERPAIPPTEADKAFGRAWVQGAVHDENCFALGGVAGHAGLFGPAGDVLRLAEEMLGALHDRAARRGDGRLFSAEAVRLFTSRAGLPEGSSRALGWDTPSGSPSSAGKLFGPGSFGHLGFTGTSLWIDSVADIVVVLLTNRTFPTRENRQIQAVRPVFHDLIRNLLKNGTLG
jgi:CubicO group peptidase (beta-lactamase class C family)